MLFPAPFSAGRRLSKAPALIQSSNAFDAMAPFIPSIESDLSGEGEEKEEEEEEFFSTETASSAKNADPNCRFLLTFITKSTERYCY